MEQHHHPILIVDDDAFQRRMIRIKLQTRGYEANEAKDGMEALRFLDEQTYSLVLLDIVMPQLNGWEVLDQIRAKFPVDELPVIMMTARDNSYDPDAARKRGATDYLTKPIDFASPDDTARLRARRTHSLLDGMLSNLEGVFFRAIGDANRNVHISFQSSGIENFLGKHWKSVAEVFASLEQHDRREVNRQFRAHGDTLQPILLRFPCRGAGDKQGWVECRSTPHRLPSGETVWDAMLLDITNRKELELDLIRARESVGAGPSAELLPLLELYRRHYRAQQTGKPSDELAASIAELEAALAPRDDDNCAHTDACDCDDDSPEAPYRDENGFIHQCTQCRKVLNRQDGGRWELVTEWTHSMPLKTTHTICASCAEAEDLLTTGPLA